MRIGDYPGWGYVMVDCLMILQLHNVMASALLEDLVSLTCLLLLRLQVIYISEILFCFRLLLYCSTLMLFNVLPCASGAEVNKVRLK